jgi:AraC-like DNA-binding protein
MSTDAVYVERRPTGSLRDAVVRLWYLRMPSPQRFEQIVPLPSVHLVVNLSEPYRVIRRGRTTVDEPHPGAFLSGLQAEYLVNENPAELHHVGAELTPWALPVFGADAPEAAGRVTDAELAFPGISRLRDRLLATAAAPDAALDDLVGFLAAQRPSGSPPDPRVVEAVDALLASPETPISDLVASSGVGHTRFLELFRRDCGTTPKRFAEVCRHHRFLTELPADGPLPSWTELIASRGYYDQPHFIREFRRFTGMTPSAYLDRRRRFGSDDPSFLALDAV